MTRERGAPEYQIRELVPEDARDVRQVLLEAWFSTYVRTGLMLAGEVLGYANPNDTALVGRQAGRIRSSLELDPLATGPDAPRYLGAFAVGATVGKEPGDELVGIVKWHNTTLDQRLSGCHAAGHVPSCGLLRVVQPNMRDAPVTYVEELDVTASHQRKGVGTRLLDTAAAHGGYALHLDVVERNAPAIEFYEAQNLSPLVQLGRLGVRSAFPGLHGTSSRRMTRVAMVRPAKNQLSSRI